MGLFSLFGKNKQESNSGDKPFQSRAAGESAAVRSRSRRKSGKQDSSAVDPVLPEKKRARRRLVGAIALVLAAVIGLPMILDSEPKPLANDIAVQIPSKDKRVNGNRSVAPVVADAQIAAAAALDQNEELIDPASLQANRPKAGSGSTPKADEVATPGASRKTEAVANVALKPEAASVAKPAAKPVEDAAHGPKAEAKPAQEAAHAPKAEAKAAAHAGEKTVEAARARNLLEGKTEPAADKKPGKFIIQVAALASRDKVDELQDRLKNAGIKSYTQRVATDNGERTRIRVGPFGSKEEAEKARARLSRLGLSGTLAPA
jgi:DedD protein